MLHTLETTVATFCLIHTIAALLTDAGHYARARMLEELDLAISWADGTSAGSTGGRTIGERLVTGGFPRWD